MIFKLTLLSFLIFFSGCQKSQTPFIAIRLKPLYEREMNAWALRNSTDTYEVPAQLFPIKINLNQKWFSAKMRIRGDLSRHWRKPSKSLRIFLQAGEYNGMREFDLVIPADKHFELEAVAYEFAKIFNIPSPKYNFLPVVINHKKLGTYFLIERPNDKIVVSENNAWLESLKNKKSLYQNVFLKELGINPLALYPHIYKVSGTGRASQEAMALFATMLEQMRSGRVAWPTFIDEEGASKWLALVLYFGSEHAVLGDNLRWQFDPGTKKFTPIIYDVLSFLRLDFKSRCLVDRLSSINPWIHSWMKDPVFKSNTYKYLRQLLQRDNFLETWKRIEDEYLTDRKFVQFSRERHAIKDRILKNIQQVKESEKHEFCDP